MIRENGLSVIEQREVLGKEFKIYGTVESPLFLAKDVYNWIEHNNITLMLNNVDESEKVKIPIMNSITGLQNNTEYWFLTEDGMYEVLMQSRKPIAKEFKKKVKEILKQIRQTGGYIPINETDTDDSIMAKALLIANKTLEKKDKLIEEKDEEIKILKPKAEKFDDFLQADNAQTMNEVAKTLDIGRNTLMKFLRIKKVFMHNNMPYSKFCGRDLFKTREFTIKKKNGTTINCCQTFAMPKGLDWISDEIQSELGGLLYETNKGHIRLKTYEDYILDK